MTRISLIALLLALPACIGTQIGSGTAVTVDKDVEGTTTFVNSTFVDVFVQPGADGSRLELTCDDNLIDNLVADLNEDGELELRVVDGQNLMPRSDCTATLEVPLLTSLSQNGSGQIHVEGDLPELESVQSSGSGSIEVHGITPAVSSVRAQGSGGVFLTGITACSLSVDTSGSGESILDGLAVCDLDVRTSGSGSVVLEGTAERIIARVSGSGAVGNEAMVVQTADVDVSGSGDVELTVTESLRARLSGSGDAIIHGNPADRDVNTTGSGDVEFAN
ncbi:MAG: DUF2807 domain-containing protein [Myxococcota bacterium]